MLKINFRDTPEINERGNLVIRDFDAMGNRYKFDFGYCSSANGWQQFDTDQDASYFGVWVNVKKRQTFTYAEGDLVLVKCASQRSFAAEIADMNRFYGPAPPMAIGIDSETGQVTEFYDQRLSAADIVD